MDIIVRNNIVNLKGASLGRDFSDIVADLSIDKYGQAKVLMRPSVTLNTSIRRLPNGVLTQVSEELEKTERNSIQDNIKKRIDDVLRNRTESELQK